VSLDAKPVGRRTFTFDPSSIRLQTDARLVIVQGKGDFAGLGGEWIWQHSSSSRENMKGASGLLAVVLRDELARRFPYVYGPRSSSEASEATVLLTPTLLVSPDLDGDSRLEFEVVHMLTKAVRKFNFKTSVGREKLGYEGIVRFDVEAADLAVKAASSPEVLEFLVSATQAIRD